MSFSSVIYMKLDIHSKLMQNNPYFTHYMLLSKQFRYMQQAWTPEFDKSRFEYGHFLPSSSSYLTSVNLNFFISFMGIIIQMFYIIND